MTDKWKDILTQKSSLDPHKLMDYLEGKLSDKEKHEVESVLADSAFMDDAAEGLNEMKDKQKIASILFELNSQLHKKNTAKEKTAIQQQAAVSGLADFCNRHDYIADRIGLYNFPDVYDGIGK